MKTSPPAADTLTALVTLPAGSLAYGGDLAAPAGQPESDLPHRLGDHAAAQHKTKPPRTTKASTRDRA